MNAANGVFLLITIVLGALCLRQGSAVLWEGVRSGGNSFLQMLPLLVFCFLIAGFVEALLPRALVEQWLSDEAGWRGIGVAWLAGALTPGGGPVGLPLAAGLMRNGAGVGVMVTYLTSLALLSFIRLPMEYGMLGGRMTLIRLGASVLLPPLAGMVAQFFVGG